MNSELPGWHSTTILDADDETVLAVSCWGCVVVAVDIASGAAIAECAHLDKPAVLLAPAGLGLVDPWSVALDDESSSVHAFTFGGDLLSWHLAEVDADSVTATVTPWVLAAKVPRLRARRAVKVDPGWRNEFTLDLGSGVSLRVDDPVSVEHNGVTAAVSGIGWYGRRWVTVPPLLLPDGDTILVGLETDKHSDHGWLACFSAKDLVAKVHAGELREVAPQLIYPFGEPYESNTGPTIEACDGSADGRRVAVASASVVQLYANDGFRLLRRIDRPDRWLAPLRVGAAGESISAVGWSGGGAVVVASAWAAAQRCDEATHRSTDRTHSEDAQLVPTTRSVVQVFDRRSLAAPPLARHEIDGAVVSIDPVGTGALVVTDGGQAFALDGSAIEEIGTVLSDGALEHAAAGEQKTVTAAGRDVRLFDLRNGESVAVFVPLDDGASVSAVRARGVRALLVDDAGCAFSIDLSQDRPIAERLPVERRVHYFSLDAGAARSRASTPRIVTGCADDGRITIVDDEGSRYHPDGNWAIGHELVDIDRRGSVDAGATLDVSGELAMYGPCGAGQGMAYGHRRVSVSPDGRCALSWGAGTATLWTSWRLVRP